MEKFTKGEWNKDKFGSIVDRKGEMITMMGVSLFMNGPQNIREEAMANRDLFLSAPKMYRTLCRVRDWMSKLDPDALGHDPHYHQIVAALKKARGE